MKTANQLPGLVITGASGFIGRNFIETFKDVYQIYAIARRNQHEVGIPRHKNIKWFLSDIADQKSINGIMTEIIANGGADYLIHLAAFFDFSNEANPEYERTNIIGSRVIFEEASRLELKRFIFASSLVVSEFPKAGQRLTEKSRLDADFPYAVTKIAGESMAREWSKTFPCTVVRFAAVFSDWCEYGPLYKFLETWSSSSWKSRVLGGQGKSAVPYIHIASLVKMLNTVLVQTDTLPEYDVLIGSPDDSNSHQQLYDESTRFIFGEVRQAIHMPVPLARFGVWMLDFLGKLIRRRPFERPWMMKYIDERMDVDASYTRDLLAWDIAPRYSLERRMLHVIENMKTFPVEWHQKNDEALYKSPDRPNLKISEALAFQEDHILSTIQELISQSSNGDRFPSYQEMDSEKLAWYLGILFNLLKVSVRTGDRLSMANYARFIASIRIHEGFKLEEVVDVYRSLSQIVIENLLTYDPVRDLEQRIRDAIDLTIQMAIDEIEEAYETAREITPYTRFDKRFPIK
ncbi:MAG: NAD(P)-dependent oxidoreductase [Candidatus Marinimicrobia bacterium]|nr:NAD(P)-dependent oxidoreductase [Candidatus Neomarinimicrobiota bacterium]